MLTTTTLDDGTEVVWDAVFVTMSSSVYTVREIDGARHLFRRGATPSTISSWFPVVLDLKYEEGPRQDERAIFIGECPSTGRKGLRIETNVVREVCMVPR